MITFVRILPVAILASAICTAVGCDYERNEYVAPPPPKVTVSHPERRDFVERAAFTGSLAATETVELRARVQGFLESIHFKDGDLVEQGQLLFVIDPKPFEADLERAKAQLEVYKAELLRAQTEYERNKNLFAKAAASESDVVKWKAQVEIFKGNIEKAQAEVALAEINLGYTRVHAPFRGPISRRQVDVGNLVGAGEETLLATITRDDPIYVYFSASEADVLRIRAKVREEIPDFDQSRGPAYKQIDLPVAVALADEEGFPHHGKIDYVDPVVDPSTGTLTARGLLPNPGRFLVPGMFVRVEMPVGKPRPALLVPERSLGVDQGGRYLLLVDDKNVVELRPVTLGPRVGSMFVVTRGLSEEDRVVVNGIQQARPGATVTPVMAQDKAAESSAGSPPRPVTGKQAGSSSG